jgi:hypothetical protein
MFTSRSLAALYASTLLFAACSDEEERPDVGVSVDSGVLPDSGEAPDAGGLPDAEPAEAGVCDPVDGTGCADPQRCYFVTPPLNTAQCRIPPAMPRQHEETCSGTNCDVGLVCLDLGSGAKCHGVCDQTRGDIGCEDLSGMRDMYVCNGVMSGMVDLAYGACFGRGGNCVPHNDTCSADKVCSLPTGMGAPTCEDAGNVAIGGDCSTDNCMRGGICINLMGGPGPICFVPCNPQMPMNSGCPMGVTCNGLTGQAFGICE